MKSRAELPNPLPWDLIVWIPSRGEFERHGTVETLPPDEDLMFPENVQDIAIILPGASRDRLMREIFKLTDVQPRLAPTKNLYQRLWWVLRRLPPHYPGPVSGQRIPKDASVVPAVKAGPRKARRSTPGGGKSGSSTASSPRGVQSFFLLYRPHTIQSRDIAFADLARREQLIVAALIRVADARKKERFNRQELHDILAEDEILRQHCEEAGITPWAAFTRTRARLVRRGFIGEGPKPGTPEWHQDKFQLMPATPPRPRGRG